MATYYWVGGNGTWNNSSTTNWSTSSGGSGGSGPPTNADTAIFDTASASGNYTVTVAATAVSLSTTVANPTGGTVNLSLSGAPTLCTAAGTLTFTSGTLTLNNNNLTTGIFSSTNTNTRSIAFGSGNIVLSNTTASTTILAMANATGFTLTGTGGFSRNQAATATVQFGSTAGGSASNAPNLSITAGASSLTMTTGSYFNNLICTGSTSTVSGVVNIAGNLTLATGGSYTSIAPTFIGTSTVTCSGKTISNATVNGTSVTLADAFACGALTLTAGTFTTTASNYAVTANSINVQGATLTLNGSTVTLSSNTAAFTYTSGTINAGTSQINLSGTGVSFSGGGQTYYNVSFTNTALTTPSITGTNTFNNLTVTGRTSAGIGTLAVSADQTINGTLTLSAGTNATMRTFITSNTLGTTRTLTCAAVAFLTDIDFRDITIAGAAVSGGNLTGTRLGDCKGNSGITFDTPKTVYWNLAFNSNWNNTGWATTGGGTPAINNFPLAQDTAVFQSTSPNSGITITINAAYNIGTIDMSARTANTMTLATSTNTPTIYGNWINGTGTTLTGTGVVTFAGRGSQTITSAGKTFTQGFAISSPSGSVTLQDAFTGSTASSFSVTNGTLDLAGYNFTLTNAGGGFSIAGALTRTLAIGSGTLSIAASGTAYNAGTATNLTVTGTGTITLTSASAKTFAGGSVAYTNITLNQGGSGALTISGSNTFKNITNTYSATGATTITFAAGTQTVAAFTATGTSGNVLTLNSSVAGSKRTITLTGGGTVTTPDYLNVQDLSFTPFVTDGTDSYKWYAGANSTNSGNNSGILFSASTSVAYLLLSGTSWSVPANWNNSNNTIHLIGGGGGGGGSRTGLTRTSGSGGGGGGYTQLTNQTLAGTITYAIGAGGNGGTSGATTGSAGSNGTTTSWNGGASTANGGGGGGGGQNGAAGAAGAAGTGTTANGGAGGVGNIGNNTGGGGGGGAGGPNGVGAGGGIGNGGASIATGGGGGGNGGGSAGANATGLTFGAGGNNFGGSGGGASAGAAGTVGGGGAGAGSGITGLAGSGGDGIDISNTVGGGGGGGGTAGLTVASTVTGGLYGGGGSGGGTNAGTTSTGGAGSQGMIFIIYTPTAAASTGNFFLMFG